MSIARRLYDDFFADVNSADYRGLTCLFIALWRGHDELASWLLETGVDVEPANEHGIRPFHVCCMGRSGLGPQLLELGADPHGPDDVGRTPFYMCCASASASLGLRLLDLGADPKAAYSGYTAGEAARKSKCTELKEAITNAIAAKANIKTTGRRNNRASKMLEEL